MLAAVQQSSRVMGANSEIINDAQVAPLLVHKTSNTLCLVQLTYLPGISGSAMSIFDIDHKYAHIPTLLAINKQLLAPEAALKDRFRCLGFAGGSQQSRCNESAQGFPAHRCYMMRETSKALGKTEVSADDFVTIVRSMFCGYHDHWPKKDSCGGHLRQLWRNADPWTKIDFKKAIAEGHKDILKYYANLEGCRVDDVEDAIKSEELVSEASNELQVILHEPNQHTLLSNICEVRFPMGSYNFC